MRTMLFLATCAACVLGVLGIFVMDSSRAMAQCNEGEPVCQWQDVPEDDNADENGEFTYFASFEWALPEDPSWVIVEPEILLNDNLIEEELVITPNFLQQQDVDSVEQGVNARVFRVDGTLEDCGDDGFVELVDTSRREVHHAA